VEVSVMAVVMSSNGPAVMAPYHPTPYVSVMADSRTMVAVYFMFVYNHPSGAVVATVVDTTR
jgi:hypothetical protein